MMTIIIQADVPEWEVQGIKEHLAMEIEKYGDCRVVRIVSDGRGSGGQAVIYGWEGKNGRNAR